MTAAVMIITGPPGVGKSTVARELATRATRAVHLHTDDFWHYITSGSIPGYLPEAEAQNHTVMDVIARAAFTYAAAGFPTFIDGIVGPWMLDHFRDEARLHPEVPVHYVVLRPGRTTTQARAQARVAPTALVAEEPILAMWDQFVDLGAFERYVLDTSSDEVDDTVTRVAAALESNAFLL